MTDFNLSDIAAVTGNEGNNWILILLFAMIFGWGNGFGGGGNSDIQRAMDLNSVLTGQGAIAADIQRGIYEVNASTKDSAYNNLSEIRDVGAAVATSGANIINNLTQMQAQLQNCCCETKSQILENRYLDAQNTASINANTTAQTQKILDALSQNKIESLQAKVSELTNTLNLQSQMCGVPKINPYLYGITPNCGCNI